MARLNLFISFLLMLQTSLSNAQFTTLGPKTDAEKTADSSYIHQEYQQETMDSICSGESGLIEGAKEKDVQFVCSGEENASWMMLVQAASGAYATLMPMMMMGGSSAGNFKNKKIPNSQAKTDPKQPAPGEAPAQTSESGSTRESETKAEKKDEKQDMCILIPMVGEAATLAWEQIEQSKIQAALPATEGETPAGTEQYEYIAAIQRTHETLANTSKTKMIMYAGTAACYVTYIAQGYRDTSLFIKMGATGVLAVFYGVKMAKHNTYSDIAEKILDKLPKAGECSPNSNPQCYCSQDSTKYDPQYCLATEAVGRVSTTMNGTSCVNSNLQVDPTCDCVAAGTCFGTSMVSGLSNLNLGSAYTGSTKAALDAFSTGSYNAAEASSLANSGLSAARDAMASIANEIPKELLDEVAKNGSEAETETLVKAGVLRPFAAIASSFPKNTAAKNFATQNSASFNAQDLRKALSGQAIRFESGSGNGKKATKNDTLASATSVKAGPASGQIMQFADKAVQAAQINRNPESNLFEIITKRYQQSAQDRLK